MDAFLHPVGSKPAWVYWVRRAAALIVVGVLIALLALLGWGIAGTLNAPPAGNPSNQPSGDLSSVAQVKPCDSKSVKLSVAGFPRLSVDGLQKFNLTLANTSAAGCSYEISPQSYVLSVVSGKDKIWSTADCPEWVPAKSGIIKAKASVEFSVEWKLRRSNGSCTLDKAKLKPGTYVATATWREISGRQVLNLVG
ncbi:MAG: hypothetical protein LBU38_00205 [Propionibacteriaceae bacterium]|jgi:hypothetical protein|nr:hypothetical protein [Propionibacteriaceae bacterium]